MNFYKKITNKIGDRKFEKIIKEGLNWVFGNEDLLTMEQNGKTMQEWIEEKGEFYYSCDGVNIDVDINFHVYIECHC